MTAKIESAEEFANTLLQRLHPFDFVSVRDYDIDRARLIPDIEARDEQIRETARASSEHPGWCSEALTRADKAEARVAFLEEARAAAETFAQQHVEAAREAGRKEGLEEAAHWHFTQAKVARHRHANGDTLTAIEPPSFLGIALNHEGHQRSILALRAEIERRGK